MFKYFPNDGRNYAYGSYVSQFVVDWATVGWQLPECMKITANGDIMAHVNKGTNKNIH